MSDSPQAGVAPGTRLSYPRGDAPRVTGKAVPVLSRRDHLQAQDLQRALASCQQALLAAKQQIEILTKANAQLRNFAVRREIARDAAQCSVVNATNLRSPSSNSRATYRP